MNVGMLWLDNSSASLADKVRKAAAYYQKKYGRAPNLCLVHPSMMKDQQLEEDGGITIRPYRPVLPHHLWIGVEELPEYVKEHKAFEEHVRAKDAAAVATQLSFVELQG
jgi:hypothetical protein